MKQHFPIRISTARQAGFSLMEVMIAMVVLGVGLMGSIGMICVAAANNSGSRLNTTAATLAESAMERLVAVPQGSAGNAALTSLTDCQGNLFTMDSSQGGSPLTTSGAFTSIDFRQPAVPNYSMQYVMCSSGQNLTYDVRWRVDAGPTPATDLVTVSVRSTLTAGPAAALARPITLRTLRGN